MAPLTKKERAELKRLHRLITRGKASRKQVLRGLHLRFKDIQAAETAAA